MPIAFSKTRIMNASIRASVGTGENALVVGTVLLGGRPESTRPLLVRAAGPALLNYGVHNVVPDPQFEVHTTLSGKDKVVGQGGAWNGDPIISQVAAAVGAFPFDARSTDAALFAPGVPLGAYTVVVTSRSATKGNVLAELYDAGASTDGPELVNVSARTFVGTGEDTLIAGFVVCGDVPKRVLIRGVGPELIRFGVGAILADPKLTLYRPEGSSSTIIATNDDWNGVATIADAAAAVGAFPLRTSTSKDAAMVVTLSPGAYTAQVTGANSSTGIALVEVYALD